MKRTLPILIVLLAAVAVATPTFAGEGEKFEHRVKLKLNTGGEAIDIETEDLAVGESREFQTESGKPVVLTRTEEGLEITVDGKKIDVLGHGSAHAFFHGDDGTQVFIAHPGEGEPGGHQMVWVGDGEGGGEVHQVIKLHRGHHQNVAERLQASGALDDLDAATRDRILDELRKITSTVRVEVEKNP